MLGRIGTKVMGRRALAAAGEGAQAYLEKARSTHQGTAFDKEIAKNLKQVRKYEEKSCKGARIFIKSVEEPRRFGVAEIQGNKVLSIEEKPETPKSNFCVTGIYFYDSEVFKFIETLKPSGRGELEITDVNNAYIKQDSMEFETLKGWWTDAGTHDSYRMANNLIK